MCLSVPIGPLGSHCANHGTQHFRLILDGFVARVAGKERHALGVKASDLPDAAGPLMVIFTYSPSESSPL